MRRCLYASVAMLAVALPHAAFAQATTPGDQPAAGATQRARTTVYDAAFFAQFSPRTALDIARRVPGFSLDLGNTETRGFAGAAGNVVINGARPSSKAETLETTLARIPAQRVNRVEVGPGDLYGAEYSSKSQVLNIWMSAEGGVDANVTAVGRRIWTGYINSDISGSALIKRGASSINLSAGTGRSRNVEEGTDTLSYLPSGEEYEFRRKVNSYFDRNPNVSASWALERAPDKALRVNARWAKGRFDLTQRNHVVPVGEPDRDDSLIQHYRNPVFELGGDITRPLAGGAIKLVGLATRRKRNNFDAYLERDGRRDDGASVVGGFEQTQKARQGETLAKLNWTRSSLAGFSVETGIEGVLNTLDSDVELFGIDEDGEKVRIDLPIDQAKVKEKRGEIYFTVGRNLTPALRVDGGLNYEMSRLVVTGDTEAERSLKFFKPNIAIDWKPGGGWHTRLSLRRTVAQLDFYDFISVAELSNDRVNAGNANLLPQRAWELRWTIEKPILGDGLFKLDFGLDRISMLQDLILTEEGFSAPGNIGTGKRRFVSVNVDAPLQRFGLTGTRLKLTGQLQRTRVHDPISDSVRRFSDFYPEWEWRAEIRRDAGAFSYGMTIEDRDSFAFYRHNEIDDNFNDGPFGTMFVEYRLNPRTSITFDIDNLFDTGATRERTYFIPNRTNPEPGEFELRKRNRHMSFGLTLKQSFGGSGGVAKTN
ncbi:outer membrane beta-barrel protein [Sphingomonas sp.]|uniref:outer membrane beta-barrel protein n=1 Tax=Sphingomonas sp. TaxID=28214 RepID=UPI00286E4F65|nr:outer membrane beta-barrel protein [Sphingomonas sp.]